MQLLDYYHDIQKQIWLDLAERTLIGVYLLPALWLSIGFSIGLYQLASAFFIVNTIIITLAAYQRYYKIRYSKGDNVSQKIKSLTLMVLFSSVHWGLLLAWILFYLGLEPSAHYTIVIILTGLALIGSSTFSQFGYLGLVYAVIIMLPTTVGIIIDDVDYFEFYLILECFLVIYVYSNSKTVRIAYQLALQQRQQLKQEVKTSDKLSRTDYLTKLANRFHFIDCYQIAWQQCVASKKPISLLYVDVNFLKQINNTHGYTVGDEVLKKIGATLESIVQEPNILARYGGEEFAIVLPNLNFQEASNTANQIQRAVGEIDFFHQGNHIPFSCSIGVSCTHPTADDNAQTFLDKARTSLHQATMKSQESWQAIEKLKIF